MAALQQLNEIETILKRRDGLTNNEARDIYSSFIEDCRSLDNPFEIEELLMSDLGLELDYIMTVIDDIL